MNGSWAEIDLAKFDANIKCVRAALRRETSLMLVVKANAYGHGLCEIVKQAAASGVTWFVTAYATEARAIREILPHVRILVLGAVHPDDAPELAALNITPVVVSEEHGLALSAVARDIQRDLMQPDQESLIRAEALQRTPRPHVGLLC